MKKKLTDLEYHILRTTLDITYNALIKNIQISALFVEIQ